jgi:hypothetical protein
VQFSSSFLLITLFVRILVIKVLTEGEAVNFTVTSPFFVRGRVVSPLAGCFSAGFFNGKFFESSIIPTRADD